MADPVPDQDIQGGLSEGEKRDTVIRLAFGNDPERFEAFCRLLEEFEPPGTTVILRGSAVTGLRWRDGERFDADGPGTSDLDITLRPLMWLSGGSVRWRTIQTIIDAGYVDAFKSLHPEDPGMTLPTTDPHIRLDYVFVPKAHVGRLLACDVVRDPAAVGASDHLPVVADFRVDD